MSRLPFSTRLRRLMHQGNLTGADLARWYERPDPTVRGWIAGGDIGGPALDVEDIETRTAQLETLLRQNRVLPVPRMTPAARIVYIDDLRRKVLQGAKE